jgi:hypothetical protein
MHVRLGYKSAADFLNSPDSPFTKSKYYERINVLEAEGDENFNILNNMNIPISTRKQLKAGNFQIDGDDIVLGDKRIPVSDRGAVVEALKGLAEKAAEQSRIIDRGKKDLDKWKRKADEARKNGHSDSTPFEQALHGSISSLVRLAAEVKELPEEERIQAFKELLRILAPTWNEVMRSFNLNGTAGDDADKAVANLVDLLQGD